MQLSVPEFAEARGVSRQRAHAMIAAGRVKAQRIGRSWVIDQQEINRREVSGRPLSARMAELVIGALSGEQLELDSQERFFLGKYMDRLRAAEQPLDLLYSWLRSRELRVVDVAGNPADFAELIADRRVIASGISDPRSGLSAAREFEGYVGGSDLPQLLKSYLLVDSSSPNVRLHVVEAVPPDPLPLGFVIADLVDWNRPREDDRALELLESVPWSR